jgi:chromosome segregation ATPase
MSESRPRRAARPTVLSEEPSVQSYQRENQRLTSQVDSLRASVEKASRAERKLIERVSELEDEKDHLLAELSTLQRVKLDLARETSTNAQLSSDLDASHRANADLQKRLTQRTAQLRDTRVSLRSMAEKYEKLIDDRQSQDRKMIELMEAQIRSNEQRSVLQRQISDLEQHLDAARSFKQLLSDRAAEAESGKQRIRELTQANRQQTTSIERAQRRLQAAERHASELAAENAKLRAQKDSGRTEVLALQSRIGDLERKVRELEGERDDLAAARPRPPASPLRSETKRLEELNSQLRREIEELSGENEELVAMVAEAQDELTKSRLTNSRLSSQIRSLSQMEDVIEELTEENEALKEELERSESQQSPIRPGKGLEEVANDGIGRSESLDDADEPQDDQRRATASSRNGEEKEEEGSGPEEGEIVDAESPDDE